MAQVKQFSGYPMAERELLFLWTFGRVSYSESCSTAIGGAAVRPISRHGLRCIGVGGASMLERESDFYSERQLQDDLLMRAKPLYLKNAQSRPQTIDELSTATESRGDALYKLRNIGESFKSACPSLFT
nr:hypothetical protein CFP56_74318 [Quercus suber]